jgi:hypothetical protein
MKSCYDCVFFKEIPVEEGDGECRALPPRLQGQTINGLEYPETHNRAWPRVNQDDWCGYFKSKITRGHTEGANS